MTSALAFSSRASSAIECPAWFGRTRWTWPLTRRPPISLACSIFDCACLLLLAERRVERQVAGHDDHGDHVDGAAALGGQLDRGDHGLLGERLVVLEGDQDALVLDLLDAERLGQQHLVGLGGREAL